ncbi:hypothetical protein GCM10027431_08040 [Lysobacter rhizosphaerae]
MTERDRFSRSIHNIDSQDLDLLECLLRIDQHRPLDVRANGLLDRLVEGGLVDRENGDLSLTPAGVERCRSLQHRVASDKEAAKVLAARGFELAEITSRK